jgi:excisionase family DNA binding protein
MRNDEYLRTKQVAAMLNATIESVRAWHKQGLLPAVRTPGGHLRFRRSDVVKFYQQYQNSYNRK